MNIKSLVLVAILSATSFSAFAEMVNMNKADAAAFQHYLKGIGEKKAESIIKYRTEHKEFKTVEEIMEVKGIGEGIFKKNQADLSLTEGKVSAPKKTAAEKSEKKASKSVTEAAKEKVAKADVK